ncbi:MAG: Fe-S-containing protein [Dehalococcoidales bacterium]|nr:Fe-S-containing protein [Dehalococcoidales bacterium]
MTAALIITLREGIEAALVLGIILTYLRRTGMTSLNRYVYWGLGLAVVVSLILGIVLQMIGFDPENEYLEGTLMGIGGIFVAGMVLWMWRTAKNIKRHMEARMDNIVTESAGSRGAAIGFLAFSFFMVAREGVETVLFLAAATFGRTGILDLIGGVLGISLAALFAILFIRGSLKINLGRFFTVTSIVLLILAARLLAGSVHEFAEVGLLPMSRNVMQVLGFFVRGQTSSLIVTGLIIIPILFMLWDFRKPVTAVAAPEENSAERRKRQAALRLNRINQLGLVVTAGVVVLAIASEAFAVSPFLDPAPQPVISEKENEIRISVADWEKGFLQKFSYQVSVGEVRFLAVKLEDGTIATALDACQICGIKGYMQEKDGNVVICKVCNAPIPVDTVGRGGGCNPLPLAARTDGTTLIVQSADLEKQARRFQTKGE